MSGECADEFFGGYPWYFDTSPITPKPNRMTNSLFGWLGPRNNTPLLSFPWMRSLNIRKNLVNPKYLCENPDDYIHTLVKQTLDDTDTLPEDTEEQKTHRAMFCLNYKWFMQTLVDRKDRMSAHAGAEARVPFCDIALAQYAYNIPWHLKSAGGREKGLLRESFRGILPDEIVDRKKNPYPKTFDPQFFHAVKKMATDAVNSDGILSQIINKPFFEHLLTLEPDSVVFYGQLMRLPQLLAMLAQTDIIFREYNVKLI